MQQYLLTQQYNEKSFYSITFIQLLTPACFKGSDETRHIDQVPQEYASQKF